MRGSGSCGSCGSSVPVGQPVCSMCYGDPYYREDGYYLDWLDREYEEQDRRRAEEQQQADTVEESLRAETNTGNPPVSAGDESLDRDQDLPF